MRKLTIISSCLIMLAFSIDAFACGNRMARWKEDPTVHNNALVAWHLERGENRDAIRKVGRHFYAGAVDDFADILMKHGKLTSPKRKRMVHLAAAAVVRSEGMWARTSAKPLGELEARENLEWAVAVLEVLAEDSTEARAHLIEGRYRLEGDSAAAELGLAELAATDELPDGYSWQLLAHLEVDSAMRKEAGARAAEMLAAAEQTSPPRNARVKSWRDRDEVLSLF